MEPIQQNAWPDSNLLATADRMERVMAEIRQHWFGAALIPTPSALSVIEPGGELIMCVDCHEVEAEPLIAGAAERGAFVVATGVSRPRDLGRRLIRHGYHLVQQHWTYQYDQAAAPARPPEPPPRARLVSLLPWTESPTVEVQRVGLSDLPLWNEVAWQAFGAKGALEDALADKRRAFRNMGDRALWYLGRIRGRPVGTACIYHGYDAAQVLAVGTLPGFRGRGVATAITQHLIAEWRTGPQPLLFLDARAGSSAERIYTRLGFRPVYIRELYAPHARFARAR